MSKIKPNYDEKKHKRLKKQIYLLIIVYTLLHYTHTIFLKDNNPYFNIISNVFKIVPILIALVGLFDVHIKRHNKKDYFWFLILLGTICNLIGQLIWNYDEMVLQITKPVLEWSDFFHVLFIAFLLIAVFYKLYDKRKNKPTLILIINTIMIMCVVIAVTWVHVIFPLIVKIQNTYSSKVILYIIYAAIYSIGLFGVISLYFSIKDTNKEKKSIFMIVISFCILTLTDLFYSYLIATGSYFNWSLIDPLWSLSMFILWLSGLEYKYSLPNSKKVSEDMPRSSNVAEWTFFLSAISLMLLFIFMIIEQNIVVWICCGISIVLINVRQAITNIKNRDLIDKLGEFNEKLDIKVRERTEELLDMSLRDQLTTLYNRRAFEKKLKELIEDKSDKETLALIFLDLDKFKSVNDTLGHSFGDLLLKEVARRLNYCMNDNSTVFRQGGDEFAIIVERVEDEQEIVNLLETILNELRKPIDLDGCKTYVTCSIGISMCSEEGKDYETLVKQADVAMYHSKELGKDTYTFYNYEIDKLSSRKLTIKKELGKAIEKNQLVLNYQPQIDISADKIVGVEALVIWKHPKYGIIPPLEFIPVAEKNGLISSIGNWVLKNACEQARKWHDMGFDFIKIGVNISPKQLQQEDFVEIIKQTLQDTKLDPKYLDLEITEGIAMENEVTVISKLNELKGLGINVSMDDFGTGYSSLSYLKRFPIDTLKIPREFIMDIDSKDNKSIIEAIIAVAQKLNLNIVAEGVENKLQLDFLKSKNCSHVQGYLFSKPLPNQDLEEMLSYVD